MVKITKTETVFCTFLIEILFHYACYPYHLQEPYSENDHVPTPQTDWRLFRPGSSLRHMGDYLSCSADRRDPISPLSFFGDAVSPRRAYSSWLYAYRRKSFLAGQEESF